MKIRMKNMNKIYGLNIDALRLCYEVTEPNNINVINCLENYVWASMTIKKKAIPTKTDIKKHGLVFPIVYYTAMRYTI